MAACWVIMGAVADPASAVIVRTPSGHAVSFQPTTTLISAQRRAQAASSSQTSAPAQPNAPCRPGLDAACLSYGNGPVMLDATVTAIYWNPGAKYSYPDGPNKLPYKTEINAFLSDVAAAASASATTNFLSVLTEYYGFSGGQRNYLDYKFHAGPPQDDQAPIRDSDICLSPNGVGRACVTDAGIQAELSRYVAANGLPEGLANEYIVFLPTGVDSCFDTAGTASGCSFTAWCGYHGALTLSDGKLVAYAVEPQNSDPAYGAGCDGQGGDAAQTTINTTSHEIAESITDPNAGSGWYDWNVDPKTNQQYGELGDMCAWSFKQGDAADTPGLVPASHINQTINGHSYLLQTEWDNANSTCSISQADAGDLPPNAAFVHSASSGVTSGQAVSFDASPSSAASGASIVAYRWDFGDGQTSTTGPTATHVYEIAGAGQAADYTAALTVIDNRGMRAPAQPKTVHVVAPPPPAPPAAPTSSAPPAAPAVPAPAAVSGLPVGAPAAGNNVARRKHAAKRRSRRRHKRAVPHRRQHQRRHR